VRGRWDYLRGGGVGVGVAGPGAYI